MEDLKHAQTYSQLKMRWNTIKNYIQIEMNIRNEIQ